MSAPIAREPVVKKGKFTEERVVSPPGSGGSNARGGGLRSATAGLVRICRPDIACVRKRTAC